MNFLRIFFVLLILMLPLTAAATTEEKWSDEVSAEVLGEEMTPAEAWALCVNRAKAKAVEQIAGVEIINDSFVRDFETLTDFINVASHAWVKEVKDERREPAFQQGSDGSSVPVYRVFLKAKVVLDKDVDRGFLVKLSLNRHRFQTGDEMSIAVQSSRDSYISIFNVLSDDKVTMIYPNRYRMDRFLKKGQKLMVPDRDAGETRKLKMFNTSGKSTAKESIIAIATKDDVDLSLGDFSEAIINENISRTGSFRDLLEKIKHIPPRERALAFEVYEVESKK